MKQKKSNKEKFKLFVIGAIMFVMTVTGIGYLLSKYNKSINVEVPKVCTEMNIFDYVGLKGNDYVILDAGDHKHFAEAIFGIKVNLLNKDNISTGIIINTEASNEEYIYNDVDYVKNILIENKINLPVYLNINNIMENNDLNTETKTKLIKDFLQKCSANQIYVGVYGTDTNLCNLKKYCGISEYDAFLVKDSEEIKYDGTYYIVEDENGDIKKIAELDEIIKDNKLNNKNNFKNDKVYTLKEGETIDSVAFMSGMSVNDLLDYNDIKINDVTKGSKIIIPSLIGEEPVLNGKYKELEKPIMGCDISYAQGNNTDWKKVKENFKFAIVRCSQGLSKDDYFEKNAESCNTMGIPMGVYCYNGYNNTNTEDLKHFVSKEKEQAEKVIEILKNKNVEYPVYLDVEGNSIDSMSKEKTQEMINIWVEKMEAHGYTPGLYCNQYGYDKISKAVDYKLSDKVELWIAGGDQYTAGKTSIDISKVKPSKVLNNKEIDMAQSTDSAINSGAGNGAGHLDVDYSKIDYSQKKQYTKNKQQPIKDFKWKIYNYPFHLAGGAAGFALCGTGGLYLRKRKQQQKARQRRR